MYQLFQALIEGEEYEIDVTKVHKVLLFRDQLTVARIRSAAIIRSTSDTGALDKFEGLIPAIADWHARAIFWVQVKVMTFSYKCLVNLYTQVIWKRFYSSKLVAEKGTLYQLKVLINWTVVKSHPSKNVKPTAVNSPLLCSCCCRTVSNTYHSLSKKLSTIMLRFIC